MCPLESYLCKNVGFGGGGVEYSANYTWPLGSMLGQGDNGTSQDHVMLESLHD